MERKITKEDRQIIQIYFPDPILTLLLNGTKETEKRQSKKSR